MNNCHSIRAKKNEGTEVQNPWRLCHVHCTIIANIIYSTLYIQCIHGQMCECTGKYIHVYGNLARTKL